MIVTVTLNASVDRAVRVPSLERPGRVLAAELLRVEPAGKGVNVSRSLSALGVRSVAAGFVGRHELPHFRESFRGTLVRCRLLPVDVHTRMNTSILPRSGSHEVHLREGGQPLPPGALPALRKVLCGLAGRRTVFVFAGSLPPGFSARAFARLVEEAAGWGGGIVIDTSGPALRAALSARPALVKPNDSELAELTGMPTGTVGEVLAAARSLLRHAKTVLVSRGRRGGVCVTAEGAWSARLGRGSGRVLNTVGAGDAFLAGWLAANWRGLPAPDCLASAVAAGTANTLEPTAGRIDSAAYGRLLESVLIRAIA